MVIKVRIVFITGGGGVATWRRHQRAASILYFELDGSSVGYVHFHISKISALYHVYIIL